MHLAGQRKRQSLLPLEPHLVPMLAQASQQGSPCAVQKCPEIGLDEGFQLIRFKATAQCHPLKVPKPRLYTGKRTDRLSAYTELALCH